MRISIEIRVLAGSQILGASLLMDKIIKISTFLFVSLNLCTIIFEDNIVSLEKDQLKIALFHLHTVLFFDILRFLYFSGFFFLLKHFYSSEMSIILSFKIKFAGSSKKLLKVSSKILRVYHPKHPPRT